MRMRKATLKPLKPSIIDLSKHKEQKMRRTIITLTGLMILGTTALLADGSTINLASTAVASEVTDSTLLNSTVGIDISTSASTVNLSNTAVASEVKDSILVNSNVGIKIDDNNEDVEAEIEAGDRLPGDK